jgi:hypothetical protein
MAATREYARTRRGEDPPTTSGSTTGSRRSTSSYMPAATRACDPDRRRRRSTQPQRQPVVRPSASSRWLAACPKTRCQLEAGRRQPPWIVDTVRPRRPHRRPQFPDDESKRAWWMTTDTEQTRRSIAKCPRQVQHRHQPRLRHRTSSPPSWAGVCATSCSASSAVRRQAGVVQLADGGQAVQRRHDAHREFHKSRRPRTSTATAPSQQEDARSQTQAEGILSSRRWPRASATACRSCARR